MVKITDEFSMTSTDNLLETLKDNLTNFKKFDSDDKMNDLLNEMLSEEAFKVLVNQLVDGGIGKAEKNVVYVIFDKLIHNKARILISNEKRKNKKLRLFSCTINGEIAYGF